MSENKQEDNVIDFEKKKEEAERAKRKAEYEKLLKDAKEKIKW